MRGRVLRVGLEEWEAVSQCLGGVPSHHCGLAMFGNLEVFFVSLSLLSLCFVIIIKYSRVQKRTQAPYPYYHKWSLTICDGYFDTLNSSKMQS